MEYTVIILLLCLIFLSIQDIREKKIYDIIPILCSIIGLILHYFNGKFLFSFYGMILSFLLLFIPYFIILKWKKIEGIGFGDVLVLASIGACIGFNNAYAVLCIGFLLGSLFCFLFKKRKIALVPFLSLATIITLIGEYYYETSFINIM